MTDPFDNDPFADEAQQAPAAASSPWDDEPEAPAPVSVPNNQEKIIVQNSSEGKVVVTLKGGAGYDQSWVVLHADSFEDAAVQLEDADSVKRLIAATRNAEKYFHQTGGGAPKQQSGGQAPRTQGKPAGADQAPNGEKRYCAHGEMAFKSGVSKAGKAYKGFFCSERDRDQQCKPQFIN